MLHPAYAKAWTIDEIDAYCSKNNLYFDTKFKAWKADDKLKTLDKFSVELFEFALFENSIEDSRTCGWRNPIDLYFGSYDLNLKPTLKNTCPQKSFVFDTDYRGNFSNSFRKDYFDGNLNFNLIAGGREIEIPMDSFRPLVIISKQAWDSENHEHIIYNET
jgi:hypothetical protein